MGSTPVKHSVLNVKAVVAAFNQEKALVGAFSVIVQPVVELMDRFTALVLGEVVRAVGEGEGGEVPPLRGQLRGAVVPARDEGRVGVLHLAALLVVEPHHQHVQDRALGRVVETFCGGARVHHRNLQEDAKLYYVHSNCCYVPTHVTCHVTFLQLWIVYPLLV